MKTPEGRRTPHLVRNLLLLTLATSSSYAQLTIDQKVSDFQALAALYAKRYGPYEWKRDALGIDLFNIAPWLAQVQATKNDLDFYEVMQQYVASLNDAHDVYQLPSTFQANLNFTVDIYDGKLLVDSINRRACPRPSSGSSTATSWFRSTGRIPKSNWMACCDTKSPPTRGAPGAWRRSS